MLYNTPSYPLTTQGYPSIFSKTMPLQWDFQAMLITTYKEANQLQHSCILLPTATVPVASYTYCTCSYTTHLVLQTKCELMTCTFCVLHAFTGSCAHATFHATVRAHTNF